MQYVDLTVTICSAYAEYLDNGETEQLTTKRNSYCHFFDPFQVGDCEVKLRLDWSALDSDGHPTLDADFYDLKNGKKRRLTGERRGAHHTKAIGTGERIYEWAFKDHKRPFSIVIHWMAKAEEQLSMNDCVAAEVHQGGIKADE